MHEIRCNFRPFGIAYLQTMKKIADKPDFVATETKRLEKISSDKSVSADKKGILQKAPQHLVQFHLTLIFHSSVLQLLEKTLPE